MKKIIALIVGLFMALSISSTAYAAKPVSATNQMTTARVVSVADGSEWLLLQATRINQPGNAIWYVSWRKADGSLCSYKSNGYPYGFVTLGEKGAQTGATWGPTPSVFAWAGGNGTATSEARLQLGEATENVVGLQWIGPWTKNLDEPFSLRDCSYGVLYSSQPGKDPVVLDPSVPLPW